MRLPLLVGVLGLTGCAANPAPQIDMQAPVLAEAPAPLITTGASPAPDRHRFTYGSGESAAVSLQAWRQLTAYAVAQASRDDVLYSVPMGLPGADGGIGTRSCIDDAGSQKPFAVIFDVDETVILNRGFEYWAALGNPFDRDEWDEWANGGAPHVAPVPGAIDGVKRMRDAGITIIYNTNRRSTTAAGTAAAIEAAGFGPAIHGDTLFLSGDDAMGSNKDGRRATIADRFCVIALAGDNLGDFAHIFNDEALSVQQRRAMISRADIAPLWGAGWFALPNASYGAWQRGSVDDVFPPDARWTPKGKGQDQ